MALFSGGSSITYHLASFVLNAITTFPPFILPLVVGSVLGPRSTLRHVHYHSQYSYLFPSLDHAL